MRQSSLVLITRHVGKTLAPKHNDLGKTRIPTDHTGESVYSIAEAKVQDANIMKHGHQIKRNL